MSDYSAGHLFAGIDGFGLGLDDVGGYRTAFTVEFADFPRGILDLRVGDGVTHHRDVRDFTDPPHVDVLTGGFPCQDLSLAGKGAGIHGARSGLWSEYARIIEAARPRVVLIENVPALLRRGFEIVVGNLVELGYSVEWDCLPAAAFGAPHLRDRVFAAAHQADAPRVFGQPLPALFAEAWRELPTREDGWQTWPRAGFVSGEELATLEPIAPLADVKAGAVLFRTPTAEGYDSTRDGGPGGAPSLLTQAQQGLLPTPAARDWKDTGAGRMGRGQLPEAVRDGRLLPTPVTTDAKGSRRSTARAAHWRSSAGDTLLDRALRDADPDVDAAAAAMAAHTAQAAREEGAGAEHPSLWPTPQASDGAGGRIDAELGGTRPSGAKRAVTLATAVAHSHELWPTPKASPSGPDYARASRDGSGGDDLATAVARTESGQQLNPDWVEWLMGFPVGWTNPAVANEELVAWPWSEGEPSGIPRTARDIPHRRERLTALGNALVPAAAAWLGARVLPLLADE